MDYQEILEKLWNDYRAINPSVDKVHTLLGGKGETIVNDHIAFRTYDIENINAEVLAKTFIKVGYVEQGSYMFEEKHLLAKHYVHSTDKLAPKVFISELKTADFSPFVQKIAQLVADEVKAKAISEGELVFSKNCWGPISFDVYEKLREESEYAAWMYVYGFRANHFTVYINQLKHIDSIEELNKLLKNNSFKLNASGGEIKGSEESFLKQSSTLADEIEVEFTEGAKLVPCCYYEFAERFKQPNGELFNGFIAKSADKIFESTDKLDS